MRRENPLLNDNNFGGGGKRSKCKYLIKELLVALFKLSMQSIIWKCPKILVCLPSLSRQPWGLGRQPLPIGTPSSMFLNGDHIISLRLSWDYVISLLWLKLVNSDYDYCPCDIQVQLFGIILVVLKGYMSRSISVQLFCIILVTSKGWPHHIIKAFLGRHYFFLMTRACKLVLQLLFLRHPSLTIWNCYRCIKKIYVLRHLSSIIWYHSRCIEKGYASHHPVQLLCKVLVI